MGTNYYVRKDECDKCHRGEEEIHIGKSSAGWRFLFDKSHGYYHDKESLLKFLKGQNIWDEYNRELSKRKFWDLVDYKAGLKEHDWCGTIDGLDWSDREFR